MTTLSPNIDYDHKLLDEAYHVLDAQQKQPPASPAVQNEPDVEVSLPPRTYIPPSPQQYVSELKPTNAELALEPGALPPPTYYSYTDEPTERKPSFWRTKRGRIVLLLLAVVIVAAIIVPVVCVVVGFDDGEDRDGSGGGAGIGTGPGTDNGAGPTPNTQSGLEPTQTGGAGFSVGAPEGTAQSVPPGIGIPTGTPGDMPGVI